MYISTPILISKNLSSASKWRSSPSLADADVTKRIRIHTVPGVGECLVHPFDLPEPSSGKSTSVLLDLATLHISLVNHPGPNHELVIRSSHVPLLFLLIFLHSSVSSAFIVICRFTAPVTSPSLSAPVAPPSSEKSSYPRRHTSTHSPRLLPRLSAENFAVLLLPRLRAPVDCTCAMTLFGRRMPLMMSFRRAGTIGPFKSVDSSSSPATSFISTPGSNGAYSVSSSGFGGAFCVSLVSNGAFCVSLGSNGASCVFSSGSDVASSVFASGSDGASSLEAPSDPDAKTLEATSDPDEKTQEAPLDPKETQKAPLDTKETQKAPPNPEEETLEAPLEAESRGGDTGGAVRSRGGNNEWQRLCGNIVPLRYLTTLQISALH